MSYGTLVASCAMVVGAMFQLFLLGRAPAALVALTVGSFAWGIAAGALRTAALALPPIALIVEAAVAFEFKRIYVLDYAGGPPRTMSVFLESLFLSDLLIVAVMAGLGWAGWRWQKRRIVACV
jgi:hypothetical protein